MFFKTSLSLLAVAQAVQADFSHETYYQKVDTATAKHIANLKGRSVGTGALVDDQGFWFSTFNVGESTNLELAIDTGSTDVILNPRLYKPSSSAVNTKQTFNADYGTAESDGSGYVDLSGTIYIDTVSHPAANLTVTKQYVGDVTGDQDIAACCHDGIVGYGGVDSSSWYQPSFVQNLCTERKISSCRFGMALKNNETGTVYYGSDGTGVYAGELTTISADGLWSITGDITVNNASVIASTSIVTDSGTTTIVGPPADVNRIFTNLGIQHFTNDEGLVVGYFPCDKPFDFGMSINGVNFNVLPELMIYSRDGNNCSSTLRGFDFGVGWLMGQPFFQGKYIDHNIEDQSMGFGYLS